MKPTAKSVSDVLDGIEAAERTDDHPRTIARRKVREWRSNAERQSLPVTNVHDDKGAPTLDVDATLDHSHHQRRLGRKV